MFLSSPLPLVSLSISFPTQALRNDVPSSALLSNTLFYISAPPYITWSPAPYLNFLSHASVPSHFTLNKVRIGGFIIIIQVYCVLVESKDHERHSETIIMRLLS
jgi:hypothetical protein